MMDALEYLRIIMINSAAQFKSSEQHILVTKSLEANTNILCILPTGEGKSMHWEISAISNPQGYSIVIMPFVALIKD